MEPSFNLKPPALKTCRYELSKLDENNVVKQSSSNLKELAKDIFLYKTTLKNNNDKDDKFLINKANRMLTLINNSLEASDVKISKKFQKVVVGTEDDYSYEKKVGFSDEEISIIKELKSAPDQLFDLANEYFPKNAIKSLEIYKLAASMGHTESQDLLTNLEKDLLGAKDLYKKAISEGHKDYKERLKDVERRLYVLHSKPVLI